MMQQIFSILGLGDKALYKSITLWGLVIYNIGDELVTQLCGTPELTFAGTVIASSTACGVAVTAVQKAGVILGILGVRKAAKGNS
jgi:hypothetical protein